MLIETKAGSVELEKNEQGRVFANGARTHFTMQQLPRGERAVAIFPGWKDAPPIPLATYRFPGNDVAALDAAVRKAREDWAPLGL